MQAAHLSSAIESGDFAQANAALQQYLKWFHSGPRTLPEVAAAKLLLESGIETVRARKLQVAGNLSCVTRVFDNYVPPRNTHFWGLDA
jgi:hypothetical protein